MSRELVVIEVCDRPGSSLGDGKAMFHAQIGSSAGHWGCGRTIDEAVGSLVRCHQELFGVEIRDRVDVRR